jgi:pimeloyl-ACP methyl ester carboxylesterase
MSAQYLTTDGGKLAYEIAGSGPLVLCAPAMGDLRNAYAPLSAQLVSAGYTVVIIDPRGHGDSSTDFLHYGDEASADDFVTLVETLKKGPAILIGASFSAASATIAAARRPGLIKGVVLLGPFLRLPMGVFGIYFMKGLIAKPWGPSVWKMYSKSLWPGLGAEGAAQRADETSKALARPGRWAAFQATVSGADHRVVEPHLAKVKGIPALVVMGEKDPDFTKPADEAQWVGSNFSNAKVVTLPGVGHAPHLERPEDVARDVLAFVSELKD